jgi:hypothetical protein
VTPPETDGSEEARRTQLLTASELLKEAGYVCVMKKLQTPTGNHYF